MSNTPPPSTSASSSSNGVRFEQAINIDQQQDERLSDRTMHQQAAEGNNTSPPSERRKKKGGNKGRDQQANQAQRSGRGQRGGRGERRNGEQKAAASSGVTSPQPVPSASHPSSKKGKMRTITDVLNRIQHDPLVSGMNDDDSGRSLLSHFSVCYIDRIWGDQEVALDSYLTHEDFSDIPSHRISYVRFFDEIIWSRSAQFDGVFGSSNSEMSLHQWLEPDRVARLKQRQEQRWARMLEEDERQQREDEEMLQRLSEDIEQQRAEIAMRQAQKLEDSASEQSGSEEMEDTGSDKPATTQQASATSSSASASTISIGGLEFESLPPRRSAASAASTSLPAHPPAQPVAIPAASIPSCEDECNISCTVTLFDPHSRRILRSTDLRLSTALFDYAFLRKRIASRLKIEGGATNVKRVYVQLRQQQESPTQRNVRLNENNFLQQVRSGSELIVMAELTHTTNVSVSALLDKPAAGGAAEQMLDVKTMAQAKQREDKAGVLQTQGVVTAPPSKPPVDRSRPNYFISLRITEPSILEGLANAQSAMTQYDQRYSDFLVPPGTFHITLSLLRIKNADELATAQKVLRESQPRIMQIMSENVEKHDGAGTLAAAFSSSSSASASASHPPCLHITHLSTFNDKVVYADVARNDARHRLNRVAAFLSQAFDDAGVGCTQNNKGKKQEKTSNKKKYRKQHDPFSQSNSAEGNVLSMALDAPPTAVSASSGVPHTSDSTDPSSSSNADSIPDSFVPHLTIAKMSRQRSFNARKKDKRNKGKGKRAPNQVQKQRMGVEGEEEQQDGDLDVHMHGSEPAMDEGVDESSNMPVAAPNPFTLLSRAPSTASNMSEPEPSNASTQPIAATQPMSTTAAAPSSATALNPSTSIIRRIDAASYGQLRECDFGFQPIVRLDLCSMQEKKQDDGYYAVKQSIDITTVEESTHDS